MLHHILPRARGEFRIGGIETHPRELQIQMRLGVCFVVGVQQLFRCHLVARVERLLFTRGFVFEVINAPGAFDQTELIFHWFTHGYECETDAAVAVSEQ